MLCCKEPCFPKNSTATLMVIASVVNQRSIQATDKECKHGNAARELQRVLFLRRAGRERASESDLAEDDSSVDFREKRLFSRTRPAQDVHILSCKLMNVYEMYSAPNAPLDEYSGETIIRAPLSSSAELRSHRHVRTR